MKILYISPENTVGTLNLWKKAHESRGNECTFITLFKSKHGYESGVCLNLPFIKASTLYMKARNSYYKIFRDQKGDYNEKSGYPPIWEPNSWVEKKYFDFRDWVWSFKIESMIKKMGLLNYDIYHFEWGLGLYRDCRFVKKVSRLGKPIICTYHGQDMRTRGVIPAMNRLSHLNLTSELDLLEKHPNLEYLFLPFNTKLFKANDFIHFPVRVCHSPTNRYYKGSDNIISICRKLEKEGIIEFILIENESYEITIKKKQNCDVLIDQIHNRGGWGYGMNSIEALSMGLVCMTELVKAYKNFIPDHPFIHITKETLESKLREIVQNKKLLSIKKSESRLWVKKYHDIYNVTDKLYKYYQKL